MKYADAQFERMFPATEEALGTLRRSLRRFARDLGASAATQARIALGFSEAVAVLLPRAADDAEPAVLAVQASVEGEAVSVRVLSRSRTLHPAFERDGYALAVPLIAQVADGLIVQHRRGGRGCAIAMRFDLAERSASSHTPGDAQGLRFAFPLRGLRQARSAGAN